MPLMSGGPSGSAGADVGAGGGGEALATVAIGVVSAGFAACCGLHAAARESPSTQATIRFMMRSPIATGKIDSAAAALVKAS
jgi:hypothetical protein